MRLAIGVATLVVLGACWTAAPPPPIAPTADPPPRIALRSHPMKSPCEVSIDHVIEVSREELSKITDFAEKLQQIRDAAVDSCTELKWSPELLHCFDETADDTGLAQCQTMLTPDQTSDLMRRITEALTQAPTP